MTQFWTKISLLVKEKSHSYFLLFDYNKSNMIKNISNIMKNISNIDNEKYFLKWLGFCLTGILSNWDFIWLGLCLSVFFSQLGFCLLGLCLTGILSYWDFVLLGLCLAGILSPGILSPGIMPGWDYVGIPVKDMLVQLRFIPLKGS